MSAVCLKHVSNVCAPGVVDGELHLGEPFGLVYGAHEDHSVAKNAALQQPQRRHAVLAVLRLAGGTAHAGTVSIASLCWK